VTRRLAVFEVAIVGWTRKVPFVIEVKRPFKDTVSGIDTSPTFPELDLLLEQKYNAIVGLDSYRLLALREPMDATVVQTD
jgi:hypothetical protein